MARTRPRCLLARSALSLGAALSLVLGAGSLSLGAELDALSREAPADPFGYVTVAGGRALGQYQLFAAMAYAHARRPLRFDESPSPKVAAEDLHALDAILGFGLLPVHYGGLQVGASLPLVLESEAREGPRFGGRHGPGDPRLEAKLTFFDPEEDRIGPGLRAFARLPLGEERSFTAADATRAGLDAIFEWRSGFLRGAINAGWEWLDGSVRTPEGRWDDLLRLGVGVGVAPLRDIAGWEGLELALDVTCRTPSRRPFSREALAPVEAMGAVRYHGGRLFALLAGGGGLGDGITAAEARFEAALGVSF